ncbi:MAG: ATP-binding protein [Clostridiales bacterium]|nr:ATP-binding protein [Clostridiales bacterium]
MADMKPIDFFAFAVNMASAGQVQDAADYLKNGIIYCCRCHNPKQMEQPFMGRIYKVPIMCHCGKETHQKNEEQKRTEEREGRRKTALPNEKYRSMTLENSDMPLPLVQNYTDNWERMLEENIGLYLWGNAGSGKTYMAAAIANRLVDRGIKVYMDGVTALTNMLGDVYGGRRDEAIYRIRNCDLLVIDDFGVERSTEFAQQQAYDLLEYRVETNKPMVVTSNIPAGQLRTETDPRKIRMYSRLMGLHPEKVTGKDRRADTTSARYKDLHAFFNQTTDTKISGSFDTDDFFEAAVQRSYKEGT